MWFDVMAIPADAPHVAEAHEFLNYIMKPEVIAKATNFVFYANGNKASQQFIDKEVLEDPAIYPTDEVMKQTLHGHAVGSENAARGDAPVDQGRHRPISREQRPGRKRPGLSLTGSGGAGSLGWKENLTPGLGTGAASFIRG